MRLRILIDVDGVLVDFVEHCSSFSSAVCALISDSALRASVPGHDVFKAISREEEAQLWQYLVDNPGVVRSLVPSLEAIDALARLREIGEVVALTSPASAPPTWAHERAEWLRAMGFEKKQIVSTSRKDIVSGDVLIDDHPDHVCSWLEEQGAVKPVLGVLLLDPKHAPLSGKDALRINRSTLSGSRRAVVHSLGLVVREVAAWAHYRKRKR